MTLHGTWEEKPKKQNYKRKRRKPANDLERVFTGRKHIKTIFTSGRRQTASALSTMTTFCALIRFAFDWSTDRPRDTDELTIGLMNDTGSGLEISSASTNPRAEECGCRRHFQRVTVRARTESPAVVSSSSLRGRQTSQPLLVLSVAFDFVEYT